MYYTIGDLNKLPHSAAKKIAQRQGIQRQPHPASSELNHPTCSTTGCNNPKTITDWHWTNGKPVYRLVCSQCHDVNTAARYAVKTGANWVKTVIDVCAHKEGFNSANEYLNSKHPYRQYRLDYCENIDGRLGSKCTTTIVWTGQLDTHHVVPKSEARIIGWTEEQINHKSNLWTLCKCCHALAHRDQEVEVDIHTLQ